MSETILTLWSKPESHTAEYVVFEAHENSWQNLLLNVNGATSSLILSEFLYPKYMTYMVILEILAYCESLIIFAFVLRLPYFGL